MVYDHAGYYAVFAMGFAVIAFDILLRLIMIEKRRALQWTQPESIPEPTTVTGARDCGVSEQQHEAVMPPKQEQNEATSAPAVSEKSSVRTVLLRRLPPLITLLRHPRLLAALFGCFVQATSIAAFESVLPLFVRETFGWSPTGAGLIFACLVVPSLFSPFAGHIADLFGSRTITTIGFAGALPFWVLLRLVHHNSIRQKVLLCALLAIIGSCLTMVGAPLMAEIDHILTVEERERPGSLGKRGAAAQGFGLFNFAFACGCLIGPLWAGFVVESAGWGTMGWSLGLLNGVSAVVTFVWTGGRIKLRHRKPREDSTA